MNTPKIFFFDSKPYDIEFFDRANKKPGYNIKYYEGRLNSDSVKLVKGFNTICIFVNDLVTKTMLKSLLENGVKLIALRSAGYNNIDLKAVYRNIHIVRVPAYSPHAVAEHAVALMLTLNRKIHKAYYRTHENNFTLNGLLGFDLYGKTAGVIGTGQIGKVVIDILNGFKMKVLAHDASPDNAYAKKNNFKYVSLKTLYRESDVITLHCPLNKSTYHLINDDSISMMKDGVMIINTGRGGIIDSKALIQGLKSNKIGYAGLDVYEEESDYFFEDFSNVVLEDDVLARLLTFNNVIITSHQAFFTKEALSKIAETTLSNIEDFFAGKILQNEICYKCGNKKCLRKLNGRCF